MRFTDGSSQNIIFSICDQLVESASVKRVVAKREVTGCRDSCDESASARVIDAVNRAGQQDTKQKVQLKSRKRRLLEFRVCMPVSWTW